MSAPTKVKPLAVVPANDLVPLPHDADAECACLATAIMDERAAPEVLDLLRDPEVFFVGAHRHVWRAVLALVEKKQVIDEVTVVGELKLAGVFEAIGGLSWFSSLLRFPPVGHVAKHALIVLERAQLRRLIETCTSVLAIAKTGNVGPVPEFLAEVSRQVADAGESTATASGVESIKTIGDEVFAELHEQWAGKRDPWGLCGSFSRLHALTHGHGMGQVTVVTGVTGGGKSCYALQELTRVAGSHYGTTESADGSRVPEVVGSGLLSLELPKSQVLKRMLVQRTHLLGPHADLEGWRLRELLTGRCAATGELIAGMQGNRTWLLEEARRQLNALPIEMEDRPVDIVGVRMTALRMAARLRRRGARLRFLVLDHLHLLRFPRSAKMREDEVIADAVRELKALSVELGIHVMLIAQYKREATEDMRKRGRKPVISDIKGASAIEQIADKIVMLHVPFKLVENKAEVSGNDPEKRQRMERMATAIVGKHRDGAEGEVEMQFLGERFSFFEGSSSDDE